MLSNYNGSLHIDGTQTFTIINNISDVSVGSVDYLTSTLGHIS